LRYRIRRHEHSGAGKRAFAIRGWQVLWFLLDLTAIYVLVNFATPWLAGWTRGTLLTVLQHPTSSSQFQFLFSHTFEFSFIPGLFLGFSNAMYRRKAAQFVWLVPAVILVYQFVVFPESVFQSRFAAAFHQYLGCDFVIPEFRSWQEFATLISSNPDMTRGMDLLRFTAPFYAGVAYSLAAWVSRLPSLHRKRLRFDGQTENA
jgi:hypothetical protein